MGDIIFKLWEKEGEEGEKKKKKGRKERKGKKRESKMGRITTKDGKIYTPDLSVEYEEPSLRIGLSPLYEQVN